MQEDDPKVVLNVETRKSAKLDDKSETDVLRDIGEE